MAMVCNINFFNFSFKMHHYSEELQPVSMVVFRTDREKLLKQINRSCSIN